MKLNTFLNSLNTKKVFRYVPDESFREFESILRIRNAGSTWGIVGISLGFLVVSVALDLLRYQAGMFDQHWVYQWLFISHLLFATQIFPLYFLWRNWTAIKEGKYPHTRAVITTSLVLTCITLTSMTIFTIVERGSVLHYGIYILLINFLILLPHRWRIRFNLISLFLVILTVVIICQDDIHALAVTITEVIGITIPGFLIATYRYNENVWQFLVDKRLKEQKELIVTEREKSDQLLLNILPTSIATELKENGKVQPRQHEQVVILFSDFKGYTALSKTMTPADLVLELDSCFSAFDAIVQKYQLEKIKTLGDGYFCVGGIEEEGDEAVFRMVVAAKEMLAFMAQRKVEHLQQGIPAFDVRIGLHCGPVVAGVVGKSKFTYDIWGSTVNIASRMETAGAVGRINISEAIYQIVHPEIPCTYRGEIEAKGLGKTKMYFIDFLQKGEATS